MGSRLFGVPPSGGSSVPAAEGKFPTLDDSVPDVGRNWRRSRAPRELTAKEHTKTLPKSWTPTYARIAGGSSYDPTSIARYAVKGRTLPCQWTGHPSELSTTALRVARRSWVPTTSTGKRLVRCAISDRLRWRWCSAPRVGWPSSGISWGPTGKRHILILGLLSIKTRGLKRRTTLADRAGPE